MGMMGEGMKMPPSTARSEDVEGGARIVFTPQDTNDLAALREHFAEHAQMMTSGDCPMMSLVPALPFVFTVPRKRAA